MTPSAKLRELADEPLLRVGFGTATCLKSGARRPEAWRVEVYVDDGYWSIDVSFARQRDAILGMNALKAAGLDTVQKLREAKPRLKQIMCEALPW